MRRVSWYLVFANLTVTRSSRAVALMNHAPPSAIVREIFDISSRRARHLCARLFPPCWHTSLEDAQRQIEERVRASAAGEPRPGVYPRGSTSNGIASPSQIMNRNGGRSRAFSIHVVALSTRPSWAAPSSPQTGEKADGRDKEASRRKSCAEKETRVYVGAGLK